MLAFLKGRIGRTNYVIALLLLNGLFLGVQFWLTGVLDLRLSMGLRSQFDWPPVQPLSVIIVSLAFDAGLLWLLVRRLHDADLSGWWVAAIYALTLMIGWAISGWIALALLLAAVLVPLFLPPSIGPNRFGADPRGWESRQQFDAQQDRIRSGNI